MNKLESANSFRALNEVETKSVSGGGSGDGRVLDPRNESKEKASLSYSVKEINHNNGHTGHN